VKARTALVAKSVYPSIDAVRIEMGNTGSKATIHRYLKEIEEEDGGSALPRVAVSEAIQDLVSRLSERLSEEADARVTELQTKQTEQQRLSQEAATTLKTEISATRQQLEQTQRNLADEKTNHGKTSETLSVKTLASMQLAQQVSDLQERLASEERHRQSLEEKHQHAHQALEHFRHASKEQREQEQRKHEQQVQYFQAELKKINEVLTAKQHEAIHAQQEGVRLLGELSRAQSDLHQSQETVRKLNPLKDELSLAQRRVAELGEKLVAQEATTLHIQGSNESLKTKVEDLQRKNQQLELDLTAAKASSAAQEQVVQNMLLRLSATATAPLSIKTKQLTLPE
jgi:chromosome segregation ATPase